jgi:hypothetical protein
LIVSQRVTALSERSYTKLRPIDCLRFIDKSVPATFYKCTFT